jgi:hypothetical protein
MAEKGKGNMRHFIASLTAIAVSSSAYAGETVLYSNNVMAPVPGEGERLYRDGPFSDAMTSQGLYYNSQAFGQTFSIARDSTGVSRLRVWGSSETTSNDPQSITRLDPNISALQVSVYRYDASETEFPLVTTKPITIPVSQIIQTRTDTYVPNLLTPVFQLDMALGLTLDAGSYMLSIGGVLTNGQTAPSFIWINGERDGRSPVVGDSARFTIGEIASQWDTWLPVENAPTSGSMVLYGVPAPGAIGALLLAGARGNRRRRA